MATEPKPEPLHDQRSSTSLASTPDPEGPEDGQDPPQAQRRKGGRKPIYATSEERKQRNRQAQAAFRERRTEYIKQLEITIKHNEDALQALQHNHRTAADECLMLRYKNSLLERILLEKGIDVQAELQSKGEGSIIRPMQPTPQPPTNVPAMPRSGLNRQGQFGRRQLGIAPKIDIASGRQSGPFSPGRPLARQSYTSFQTQAPSPHSSVVSPSSQQFHFPVGGRGQEPYQQMSPTSTTSFPGGSHNSYSGPGDHEDEGASRTSEEHLISRHDGNNAFHPVSHPQQMQPNDAHYKELQMGQNSHPPLGPIGTGPDDHHSLYDSAEHLMDHDHSLDADPFGLSASMHFPTQY